jgi:hypothetical protein
MVVSSAITARLPLCPAALAQFVQHPVPDPSMGPPLHGVSGLRRYWSSSARLSSISAAE